MHLVSSQLYTTCQSTCPIAPSNKCSDNYVGALGASTLANGLRANTGIEELYIKGNDIGDEGIKALCNALAERTTPLSVLDIGNNKCAARVTCLRALACAVTRCCRNWRIAELELSITLMCPKCFNCTSAGVTMQLMLA